MRSSLRMAYRECKATQTPCQSFLTRSARSAPGPPKAGATSDIGARAGANAPAARAPSLHRRVHLATAGVRAQQARGSVVLPWADPVRGTGMEAGTDTPLRGAGRAGASGKEASTTANSSMVQVSSPTHSIQRPASHGPLCGAQLLQKRADGGQGTRPSLQSEDGLVHRELPARTQPLARQPTRLD